MKKSSGNGIKVQIEFELTSLFEMEGKCPVITKLFIRLDFKRNSQKSFLSPLTGLTLPCLKECITEQTKSLTGILE